MVVAHFWVVMGKAADSWTDVMRRSQDANEGGCGEGTSKLWASCWPRWMMTAFTGTENAVGTAEFG